MTTMMGWCLVARMGALGSWYLENSKAFHTTNEVYQ